MFSTQLKYYFSMILGFLVIMTLIALVTSDTFVKTAFVTSFIWLKNHIIEILIFLYCVGFIYAVDKTATENQQSEGD